MRLSKREREEYRYMARAWGALARGHLSKGDAEAAGWAARWAARHAQCAYFDVSLFHYLVWKRESML